MAEIKNLNNDELKIQGRLRLKGTDGTLYWGSSGNSGRLTWDTGKVDVLALSGQALSLGSGGTTNRLYINTSGNVGIGTTSPKSQLHIYESNTGGIGGELRLDNNGSAVANKTRILFSDAGGNSASFDRAAIVVETENSPYNGQFQFQTGFGTLTTKMIISGAGNVGIGTTSPNAKLEVRSDGSAAGGAEIRLQHANNNSTDVVSTLNFANNVGSVAMIQAGTTGANNTGYISFFTDNAGTSSEKMRILGNGKVGIGTASADSNLHVYTSSGQANIKIQSGSNDAVFFANPAVNFGIWGFDNTRLSLATNSTERVSITGDGNVGIGTTSPAFTSGSGLEIQRAGTATLRLDSGNLATELRAYTDGTFLGQLSASYLDLGTNNTSRVRIDSGGNVGIGTTSPENRLHLLTSTTDTTQQLLIQNGSTGDAAIKFNISGDTYSIGIDNSDGDKFKISASNLGTNDRIVIDSTGNVGIGTSSPGHKLHVVGGNIFGSSNVLAANNVYAAGPNGFVFGSSTSEGEYIYRSGNDIRVYANGSDRLTILGTGNVGIGTTSPGARLDVNSNISSSSTDVIKLSQATNGDIKAAASLGLSIQNGGESTNAADLWFTTANGGSLSERMRITSGGNVGIGTTNPTRTLHVVGGDSGTGTHIAHFEGRFGVVGMYIRGDGNVGIGTTSPAAQLHVYSTGNGELEVQRESGALFNIQAQASLATIGTDSNHPLYLKTNAGTRVAITTSGNVGIGTTSPNAQLQIDTPATNQAGQGLRLNRPSAGTNYHSVEFATNGTVDWSVGQNSNDAFEVYENGFAASTRFTIKEGGNVGIGSTAPAARLNVASTGANAYSSTITKGTNMKGIINALSNNADDMVGIYFGTGTTSEGTHWSGITGSRSQSTTDWSTQLNFYTHNEDVANINDATQKMVIKGNGNVGIGTTSPGAKLDVDGNIKLSGYIVDSNSEIIDFAINDLKVQGKHINAEFGVWARSYGTVRQMGIDGGAAHMGLYTSGTEKVRIDTSGNVGIGTTAPQQALHIKGATNALMMLEGDNDNGIAGCYYKTEDTDDTMNRTKGFFGFQGNNLYGNGYFTMWLDNVNDNGTVTASEERFRWERDGDFHADGDVIAYSTTTPSDIRLKTDVETIESASEKVSKLRGVEYTWSKGKLAGQREIGLIAQEVEAVVPEVVKEKELPLWDDSGESYKTVDYEKLVALLIESNKEMQEEIKQLKERLDGITE